MALTYSGYITRTNLSTPEGHLDINVDPYYFLLGDQQEAADMSMQPGLAPMTSAVKYVWASSPYVIGQQLVMSVPDNSTLDLRIAIDGADMLDVQDKVRSLIQAVRTQVAFEVSITYTTTSYRWNCFTGTYLVAFNQLFYFDYLLPIYLSLPRTPVPLAGPV